MKKLDNSISKMLNFTNFFTILCRIEISIFSWTILCRIEFSWLQFMNSFSISSPNLMRSKHNQIQIANNIKNFHMNYKCYVILYNFSLSFNYIVCTMKFSLFKRTTFRTNIVVDLEKFKISEIDMSLGRIEYPNSHQMYLVRGFFFFFFKYYYFHMHKIIETFRH